ncbi:hypothetical protein GCM10010913_26330 [Paenibacillus aceti]|uniref:Metallo-beta-lactamase domain-containing protein n=1 Tax=Paenibacillus aceti TaxID=1820010 RepID=A0ABQ1VWU9_9BACL|nr:hypothetical protein GCM10010913_26330 [Paenibacillus aceti]
MIDAGNSPGHARVVELHHVESDHTVDSTIIYIPHEKVLFLSDCLSPNIGRMIYFMRKEK